MGNTSSQMASSQMQAIDGVIPSHDDSDMDIDMDVASERFSTPDAMPQPRGKRSLASANEDGARPASSNIVKREREDGARPKSSRSVKLEEESPRTTQKRLRSLPQHLRGTSIMPSQDVAAASRPTSSQSSSMNKSTQLANTRSRDSAQSEALDETQLSRELNTAATAGQNGEGAQLGAENSGTSQIDESGLQRKQRKRKRESGPQSLQESNVVEDQSAIGAPRARSQTTGRSKPQPKDVQKPRTLDGITVNPIGKPGPPKRKKRKTRNTIVGSSATNQPIQTGPQVGPTNLPSSNITVNVNEPAVRADRILTPPESPDAEDDGQNQAGAANQEQNDGEPDTHDPRVPSNANSAPRVQSWLNNHETPAPPDNLSPSRGSPIMQRKSTQTMTNRPDGDFSQVEESNPPNTETAGLERGAIAGGWSAAEKALADATFKRACEETGRDDSEMKASIADWANATEIKDSMYAAFPGRTFTSIRKFCRRRFTSFDTGLWTERQDEKLKKAYAKHPQSWVKIQKEVHRGAEDCRTRWRVKNGFADENNTGPWSREEEQALVAMVDQHLPLVRELCENEEMKKNAEAVEKMLHWDSIAKDLGGHRTGQKCRTKWYRLKNRADVQQSIEAFVPDFGQGKKAMKAERDYAKLGWADVWDAMNEIHSAFTATEIINDHYAHETTVWSMVAMRNSGSRFGGMLRRRCYYEAMGKWGQGMRSRNAIGLKAYWMYHVIAREAFAGRITFERRWNVIASGAVAGDGLPSLPRMMKRRNTVDMNFPFPEIIEPFPGEDEQELEVPETQTQTQDGADAVAGAQEGAVDDGDVDKEDVGEVLEMSSVNSRMGGSLRSETPQLNSREFLQRCQAAARAHRAYQAQVTPRRRVVNGRVVRE